MISFTPFSHSAHGTIYDMFEQDETILGGIYHVSLFYYRELALAMNTEGI